MLSQLHSKSSMLVGMFGLGTTELLVILALVLILFGAGKIPQLGRGLGEGIRNFKKGLKEGDNQQASGSKDALPPPGNEQSPTSQS